MSIADWQLADWKETRQQLLRDLEQLESGRLHLGSNDGSGWVDITVESVARLKRVIATYNAMITEAEKLGADRA